MAKQLWERDALVLEEYTSVWGERRYSPEKRLLLAVLMRALLEFRAVVESPDARDETRLTELRSWFFSRDPAWPFSFENLCQHLDLDPGWIRSRLTALSRSKDAASRRPASECGSP